MEAEEILTMHRIVEDGVTYYRIRSPIAPGLYIASTDFDACLADVRPVWTFLHQHAENQVEAPPPLAAQQSVIEAK